MALYLITNTASGHTLGVYEADSAADALDVMARDAGYASFAASCEARETDEQVERDEMDVQRHRSMA